MSVRLSERGTATANGASPSPAELIERHRKLLGSIAGVDGQIAAASTALAVAENQLKRHESARTAVRPCFGGR